MCLINLCTTCWFVCGIIVLIRTQICGDPSGHVHINWCHEQLLFLLLAGSIFFVLTALAVILHFELWALCCVFWVLPTICLKFCWRFQDLAFISRDMNLGSFYMVAVFIRTVLDLSLFSRLNWMSWSQNEQWLRLSSGKQVFLVTASCVYQPCTTLFL